MCGVGVQLLKSREGLPEQGSVSDPVWSKEPLRPYSRVHRSPKEVDGIYSWSQGIVLLLAS